MRFPAKEGDRTVPSWISSRTVPGRDVDGEQGRVAQVLGRHQQGPAVRGEGHGADGSVPVLGENPGLPLRPVLKENPEPIRLEAGPLHGQIGQGPPVGAEDRLGVPGPVLRGQERGPLGSRRSGAT